MPASEVLTQKKKGRGRRDRQKTGGGNEVCLYQRYSQRRRKRKDGETDRQKTGGNEVCLCQRY